MEEWNNKVRTDVDGDGVVERVMNGPAISSGMGTCGLVGQTGVCTGWLNDIAEGEKAAITIVEWIGLILVCFILSAVLSTLFCIILRHTGWIKEWNLTLE